MTRTRWLLVGLLAGLALAGALVFPGPRRAVAQGILALVVEKPGTAVPTHVLLTGTKAVAAGAPTAVTAGQTAAQLSTLEGLPYVAWYHPNPVQCRLTTAATTSTAITGCTAPGAGKSIYVTDISVYGGVAVGATAAASIQYGTGGTCGVGTTIIYDCQHPATAGCEHSMAQPIKLTANNELCIVDATVGTKFVSVSGFIAP